MKRSNSESSGEGDEFFDAVERLDDSHEDGDGDGGDNNYRRLESLRESNLEEDEESQSAAGDDSSSIPARESDGSGREMWMSAKDVCGEEMDGGGGSQQSVQSVSDPVPPSRVQHRRQQQQRQQRQDKGERNEAPVSAKCLVKDVSHGSLHESSVHSRGSLMDAASLSPEESDDSEEDNDEDCDEAENDGVNVANVALHEGENGVGAPSMPIVPPINLGGLPPRDDREIYTVSTEEIRDVVERGYDEDEMQTLNRLVDKLQSAEASRRLRAVVDDVRNAGESKEGDANSAESEGAQIIEGEQDEDEQFLTPLRGGPLDCGNFQTVCDIKSPLEALYLFCQRPLDLALQKGGVEIQRKLEPPDSPPTRTSMASEDDASPRTRTSVASENDTSPRMRTSIASDDDRGSRTRLSVASEDGAAGGRGLPPPPLSDEVEVRPDAEGDSSDSDSSVSSDKKYQMVNHDTGSVHDMRDVMRQIDEVGGSDILDTRYSFFPSKEILSQRQMSMQEVETKASEESKGLEALPLAAASFDSCITEESSSPKASTDRKRGIKFSKMATSKMAANVRKGVAGLKTSRRQQKLNRKRTTSADMLPGNAVYVRTRRRHGRGQESSALSEHSHQDVAADSSFNPMLLVRTLPSVHTGPAWCASFSSTGRFLATGGEDGNVCIWAVAPRSKVMHPNGAPAAATPQEEGALETSGSEDTENVECVARDDSKEGDDEDDEAAPPLTFIGSGPELATKLEILSSEPVQRFKDHTADVIDLSWSHTNFLLTASLDSTVRLYHHSKPACLHLFKHANLVASVAFHPSDDRYFISGGVDRKLRLWDITEGRVKEWAQSPDVITAARFTPDGKYAVAGLFRGQVYFYDTDGLKYYTQIACRNRSGKHRMGRKVTGISFVRGEREDWLQARQKALQEEQQSPNGNNSSLTERLSDTGKDVARRVTSAVFRYSTSRSEVLRYTERMLVTTNDSRVRLYGLNDFCLVRKYKGHTNGSMQIRARVSESGDHIACGSETGHVFIWDTLDKSRQKKSNHVNVKVHSTHDKTKGDHFEASKAPLPIITDSVFFPAKSVDESLLSSDQVFPFALGMDRVDDDMSSAAILTLDYAGTMRVFLRKSCIDAILDAATPRGGTMT